MSCYSVVRGRISGSSQVDMKSATPLAVGAAVGGIAGKSMFQAVESMFADKKYSRRGSGGMSCRDYPGYIDLYGKKGED